MKLRFGSLTLGAALLSAPVAFAQTTLVSWGPSSTLMDTGTGNSQRTSAGGALSFDLTNPITPLAFNSSNGRTYSGGVFYGGITSANTPSLSAGVAVRNAAFGDGTDAQVFGKGTTAEVGYSLNGVFLWKQQDFISGSDTVNQRVELTSMTYDALLLNGSGTNLEGRFVIQQGSSYMISNNLGLAAFSQVHTSSNLSSLSWFSYAPSGTTISTSVIGSQITSPVFTNVTAAGLYLTGQSTAAGVGFLLAFSQFSASGIVTAVPEPSSAAVLAGMGALGFVASRRRKR